MTTFRNHHNLLQFLYFVYRTILTATRHCPPPIRLRPNPAIQTHFTPPDRGRPMSEGLNKRCCNFLNQSNQISSKPKYKITQTKTMQLVSYGTRLRRTTATRQMYTTSSHSAFSPPIPFTKGQKVWNFASIGDTAILCAALIISTRSHQSVPKFRVWCHGDGSLFSSNLTQFGRPLLGVEFGSPPTPPPLKKS